MVLGPRRTEGSFAADSRRQQELPDSQLRPFRLHAAGSIPSLPPVHRLHHCGAAKPGHKWPYRRHFFHPRKLLNGATALLEALLGL